MYDTYILYGLMQTPFLVVHYIGFQVLGDLEVSYNGISVDKSGFTSDNKSLLFVVLANCC